MSGPDRMAVTEGEGMGVGWEAEGWIYKMWRSRCMMGLQVRNE